MARISARIVLLVTVFAVQLGLSSDVSADPIQATYNTTGSISSIGVDGTPIVSFQGVTAGTMTVGQPFSLGNFIVTSPPGGGITTYFTPFTITFNITSASGDPALPQTAPVTLTGNLITNDTGQASLRVIFPPGDPVVEGPSPLTYQYGIFEGGALGYILFPTVAGIALEPTSQNGGIFSVPAVMDEVHTVPEPAPIAMAVAVGLFLALRRYLGPRLGGRAALKMRKTCPR